MSNYRITYLLGAGASYHSIPVVNTLNDRMRLFYEMFIETSTPIDFGLSNDKEKKSMGLLTRNKNSFYEDYKEFVDFIVRFKPTFYEAINHRTVDTFARKLFLQGKKDELNDLKRFLAAYFAFEQSDEVNKIIRNSSVFQKLNDESQTAESLYNHLNKTLDYRYDVFFASLLNKEMKLPDNVNIISWNYDLQIEMGFQNYSELPIDECQKKLLVYPRDSVYPQEEDLSGKIIKLNGSAHQYYDEINDTYLFNNSEGSIYKSILNSFSEDSLKKKVIALNFAWERGPKQLIAVKVAESILFNTDELVIIGYSFPYFNREIDIKLMMKTLNRVKKIKLMVHPDDFKGVKQSVEDIIGEFAGSVVPELHEDLDQFYIPSKFFGNPYNGPIMQNSAGVH